jgi:hypothetical protein
MAATSLQRPGDRLAGSTALPLFPHFTTRRKVRRTGASPPCARVLRAGDSGRLCHPGTTPGAGTLPGSLIT